MALTFSAHVWYRRSSHAGYRSPAPPRAAVVAMLSDIAARLAAAGARPVGLRCETWPAGAFAASGHADHLARITIAAEAGEATRPLSSWYEWQHPAWNFAGDGHAVSGDVLRLLGGAAS